ncbi:DUF6086 family protein [Herpetosiphon geysericola]|nr:DUF6086 family protein [Herpetosiphon geysericola]
MDYSYNPYFFTEAYGGINEITLWEVGLNAGQLFFAQIEAFEKIFNQHSGFYDTQADAIYLLDAGKLKALIDAMLGYYNAARHNPLRSILFDSSIQILLVLYKRAMGEWLPAPAALMDTIEQIEIAMGRGYLKRND